MAQTLVPCEPYPMVSVQIWVGGAPAPITPSRSCLVARHSALLLGPQQSSAVNDSLGHQDSSLKKLENRPEKISNPVPYSSTETVLLGTRRAVALGKTTFPKGPHGNDLPKENRSGLANLLKLASERAEKGLSCPLMRNKSENKSLCGPHRAIRLLHARFISSQNSLKEKFR